MILLDPDMDPDPAPKASSVKRAAASSAAKKSADFRLPSARALGRFLSEAQAAVRLKGQVTVLLTTDAAIRKLNRQFRGKNKATDVLSFPSEGPFPGSPTEKIAGDIAISVTTALGQAADHGHSLSTEIKVLILHGLLHLAGYDHEADSGQMARRERLLRGKLGLPQGLIERAVHQEGQALKGHGFSRAVTIPKKTAALAAEGMQFAKKTVPQGLKPRISSAPQSARLKSCPFKASVDADCRGMKSRPIKANKLALTPSSNTALSAPKRAAKAKRP
jgi:probable rRNA maturation factor